MVESESNFKSSIKLSKDKSELSIREDVPGLPNDEHINAVTDLYVSNIDAIGENTEELSDFSDNTPALGYQASKDADFIDQIKPLMKNRRVRCFSFTNSILVFVNVCLLIGVIVFAIFLILTWIEVNYERSKDIPCIYEWTEWSKCSKECRDDSNEMPMRYRKVKPESIVQARGKYEKIAPCPSNLVSLVDSAPCNTYKCPIKLSDICYNDTVYMVPGSSNKQECYQIRDLPQDDILIQIDGENPKLTVIPEDCTGDRKHEDSCSHVKSVIEAENSNSTLSN